MAKLPLEARVYIAATVVLACAVIATAGPIEWDVYAMLAILFVGCDAMSAQFGVDRAKVSMSYAATLAAVVLLGPGGAALVAASAIATPQPVPPVKRLFNAAQFAVCGWTSGLVFEALAPGAGFGARQIVPFALALGVFVVVNLTLITGVLLLTEPSAVRDLFGEIGALCAGCLGFGWFGLLIAAAWDLIGLAAPVLVLLPLFIATWAMAQVAEQKAAQEATLAVLCQAVETKDPYTRGHSERVSRGSVMIAEELGLSSARVEAIRFAGMLHDVGKLGVSTKVLQKDGKPTDREFAEIQLHPMRGLEIVGRIDFLDEALGGIMHHHERLDGRGYPLGLVGDEIPEFARIIGVADTFDAITSTRSYRRARSIEEGVAELRRCSGTEFDPAMVEAFLRALAVRKWEQPPDPPAPSPSAIPSPRDHDDPEP
ncbi:HD-GYP domain-containing protein [Actinocorallia sp. A-T 12471]|uniref:HD-GYP domain-containing protein n=1 Tax=Actinocorallia sp. A-T 12471 TaxID=3089813 RepID=UPI0029CDE2AF|nr:HD-GYP domain-containing protein [Actinocorallia sp. A-T 12471]MDX6739824.1 HD-GYP domain-containing protein [Actinocorallia sp. A-T 12471]